MNTPWNQSCLYAGNTRREAAALALLAVLGWGLVNAPARAGELGLRPLTEPRYRVTYSRRTGFLAFLAVAEPPQAPGPRGFDQVSVAVFDSVNNALRINATPAPGGTHTPGDANQVFTSIFDPTNRAVRVICVLGCGGGGAPGGSSTQVQFNNSNAFGGSPNLTWFSPALAIGANASATGQLLLANGGAGGASVAIQNNGATSAYNFNLPVSAGTSGQCLQSGGGGSAPNAWGVCGGAPPGSNTNVIYNNNSAYAANGNFTTDGNGNATLAGTVSANGFVGSGTGAGCIRLPEAAANGTNYIQLCSPEGPYSPVANYTVNLPTADGAANQALITNGSATWSFGSLGNIAGSLVLGQTPLTASQDILYDNAGALARLPISIVTSGQCLGNNSGTWGSFPCSGGGGAVTSVFGRTGAVVASANDYTLDQLGPLAASATNTFNPGSTWTAAGAITAGGTSAVTITNANSTNNNSSSALTVSTTGTSTGAVPLIVNEGTGAGDIADFQVGGVNKFTISTLGTITTQANINLAQGGFVAAGNGPGTLTVRGQDLGTALSGSVIVRGGNISGGSTASLTAEPLTLQGGDNLSTGNNNNGGATTLRGGDVTAGTGTGDVAGNLTIRGGNYTGGVTGAGTGGNATLFGGSSNATAPTYGIHQLGAYFNKTGTITAAADIVCATGDMQVSDCATTPNLAVVGVALGTTAPIQVVMEGEALINTDGTAAVGNQVCLSTTTAGNGHAQAGVCTVGQGIGTVISITSQGSSGTKPLVAIHRY